MSENTTDNPDKFMDDHFRIIFVTEQPADHSPAVENLKRHDVLRALDPRPRWNGEGSC